MNKSTPATRTLNRAAALLVLLAIPVTSTWAQALRSGEAIYKETCAACHETGAAKSPRLGDKKAWAPLLREGQVTLTVDGWLGERAMPPKGGNNNLTLEEFARGVVYM